MAVPRGVLRGGGPLALVAVLLLLLLEPRLSEAAQGGWAALSGSRFPSGSARREPGANPRTAAPVLRSTGPTGEAPLSSVTPAALHDTQPNPSTPAAGPGRIPGCGHRLMRIVGGLPAAEKKWPWQVSLHTSNGHICGASLIDRQWVLTAAHCIYGHLEYTAKLGDINVLHQSSTAAIVPIRDIVIHKDYNAVGKIANDIALAMLEFPVNYSSHIQPVCLPEKTFQVQANTKCWVTGWGKLDESDNGKKAPLTLQEADLNIIRYKECNRMLQKKLSSSSEFVKEGVVCGYSDLGKDSCQGDSGGPLVCEFNKTWMQVGIVSWGIGCGRKGIPGVYTEISYYKEWLIRHLNPSSSAELEGFALLLLSLVLTLNITC